MKIFVYLFSGFIFGIIMYKSEAASWFRIYEMFEFASFHMYGIFASALAVGITGIGVMKRYGVKTIYGQQPELRNKNFSLIRNLSGGIIFGLGWALAGACPGPMYVLVGAGYPTIGIVLLGALLGTFAYGMVRHKLPP